METEPVVPRLAALLRKLREERGVSQLQLADCAGVKPSVVNRAERGMDAKLSTWDKLFAGLGYCLALDATESSEEAADVLGEEADKRRQRRLQGLCAGKRRYW